MRYSDIDRHCVYCFCGVMRVSNFIAIATVDYIKILRICTFEHSFIVLCIFSVRQVIDILCST